MLTADYWIALQSDPDAVIMTPAKSRRFNEKAATKRIEFTDYFGKEDPLRENYLTSSANGLVMPCSTR